MFGRLDITPLALDALVLLARSPGKEYYLRELAGILRRSPSGCGDALELLRRMGLVERRPSGRNVYFTAADHPAMKPFKTFATIAELSPIMEALRPLARRVVLYGSCASGEDTITSDIDLLVVADDVVATTRALNRCKTTRRLSPVVLTPVDLLRLDKSDRSFQTSIARGLVLWDRLGADELARLVSEEELARQDISRRREDRQGAPVGEVRPGAGPKEPFRGGC